MKIAITLVAAMLAGAGFVLQQHAAQQAPKCYFLRLRLITSLLHRPRWLAGVAVMAAGQLLSAWAIGHVALSLAEPLLTSSLIFALALAVPLSGQRLRTAEILGAVLLSAGVAALSVARSAGSPAESFGSFAAWPTAAGVAVVAAGFLVAGLHRTGQQRATMTGAAAGLIFGVSDALTRRAVETLGHHSVLALLAGWPGYCLVAASLAGFWLMESAFSAAPLHASLPAITAAEPIAGMLLGVVVFGDVVHVSPAMLLLQGAGLAALMLGVILVARAPVLSRLSRPARTRRRVGQASQVRANPVCCGPGLGPIGRRPVAGAAARPARCRRGRERYRPEHP
jgi:drug/metabolite transporter (DMT)-like permease